MLIEGGELDITATNTANQRRKFGVMADNAHGARCPRQEILDSESRRPKTVSLFWLFAFTGVLLIPRFAMASAPGSPSVDFTNHWVGFTCVVIFVLGYALVIGEEFLHLRKSKPVMIAAGLIWAIVALALAHHGDTETAETAVRHNLLEFAELFLFLLAAMTYINTMDERGVFDVLRAWLVHQGFSLRKIYWITGLLSFVMSPVADNLTTALLMAAVVMAVGGSRKRFAVVGCINVVVAANAGGAFSPFGDITTLMVWQKGIVQFQEFFVLFIPSVVNWIIPACIMAFAVPKAMPEASTEEVQLRHGAWVVVGLFLLTITMAVSAHNFLHLPPVVGMMTGLGFLKIYGYYLKRRKTFVDPAEDNIGDIGMEVEQSFSDPHPASRDRAPALVIPELTITIPETTVSLSGATPSIPRPNVSIPQPVLVDPGQPDKETEQEFDIFTKLARAEWDTLMFFYGIILCVGGLGTLGYLSLLSQLMYVDLGPTWANVLVGFLSALIDNIPVMFAVLAMSPEMSHGQWLLVTLTAGVGGSMLSIGSAAGVAVMGTARGVYTFLAHLKWSWAIAIGYAASIGVHMLVNGHHF